MADLGEVVLPRWQPDDELSNCSICGSWFTFLNRRHHCRRCGRLVCATCSPHRITIPRQYIVRPPEERLYDDDAEFMRSRSNPDTAEYLDNLGGGETVRVCNPCVPDPNYGPPPQHENPTSPPPSIRSRASTYAHGTRPVSGSAQPRDVVRPVQDVRDDPVQTHSHSVPSGLRLADQIRQSDDSRRPSIQAALQNMPQTRRMRASISTQRTRSDDISTTLRQRYPPPPITTNSTTPASLPVTSSAQRPHSRDTTKSSDEDECPVCGTRDPPFGLNGISADRERHVEQCLASHFTFAAGPSNRPTPGPGVEIPEHPLTPGSYGSPGISSPSLRQRMLIYRATEKDCFDESGDPQECVICFEEFQPGDEMGRLECLCRFHRVCIRGWWATKGPGSCPTHQLHG